MANPLARRAAAPLPMGDYDGPNLRDYPPNVTGYVDWINDRFRHCGRNDRWETFMLDGKRACGPAMTRHAPQRPSQA